MAAHRRPRQARGAVRRHLPARRLRAVQPGQRRLPAHRRAHAVQVALARPAHLADLADVDAARQLRDARCRRSSGSARAGSPARPTRSTSRSTSSTTSSRTYVVVFGADHVYRMDPRQMVEQHIASGAGVTVAGIRVPRDQAHAFGVIQTARRPARSTTSSRSRPTRPACPDDPDSVVRLHGQLRLHHRRAARGGAQGRRRRGLRARHGRQHHPDARRRDGDAEVYDFADNEVPGATDRDRGYWRDVGTIDAYYDAHMDLVSVQPVFNLYNRPLADPHRTRRRCRRRSSCTTSRAAPGHAIDSLVSAGCDRLRRAGAPVGAVAGGARALRRGGRADRC